MGNQDDYSIKLTVPIKFLDEDFKELVKSLERARKKLTSEEAAQLSDFFGTIDEEESAERIILKLIELCDEKGIDVEDKAELKAFLENDDSLLGVLRSVLREYTESADRKAQCFEEIQDALENHDLNRLIDKVDTLLFSASCILINAAKENNWSEEEQKDFLRDRIEFFWNILFSESGTIGKVLH